MSTRQKWIIAVLTLMLLAGFSLLPVGAADEEGWRKIGSFSADGKSKEMTLDAQIEFCKIKCTGGEIRINTLIVMTDNDKVPFRPRAVLKSGEEHTVKFEKKLNVHLLRLSDSNGGAYEVYVK